MNREIKFRGKRVDNGDWVYGSLVNNLWTTAKDDAPVCEIITGDYIGDCWEDVAQDEENAIVEVFPETVGQLLTKVKNNNGTIEEIYEDDLIIHGNHVRQVKFYHGNTVLVSPSGSDCILLSFNEGQQKVGNIHDNPELITQSSNAV